MHHQPIFSPFLTILLHLLPTTQTKAQTVSTTPLLACSLITFNCPNTNGCCTIGGCCGSSCCPSGYSCIDEGTSSQACCSVWDTTKCGTVDTTIINNQSNGNNNNPQVKTCNTIQNCGIDPVRGLGWTCVLGQTCGLSYNQCNACPYIFNIGSSPSSSVTTSPSTATISSEEGSASTSVRSGTTAVAGTTSGGSGAVGTTVPNNGVRECGFGGKGGWVSFVFVGVVGVVVL